MTPKEIATSFAILGHPVRAEAVPRETWESLFKSQGMKNPAPRIQMLDGLNEGWIDFEGKGVGSRKGKVALESVLRTLIRAREWEESSLQHHLSFHRTRNLLHH